MPSAEKTPNEKFEINFDSHIKDGCYFGRRRLLLHCRTHGGAGARFPFKGQSDKSDRGGRDGACDGGKTERSDEGPCCKPGVKRRAFGEEEEERKAEVLESEEIRTSAENRSRERAKKPKLPEDSEDVEEKPSPFWDGDLDSPSTGEEGQMAGNSDRDNYRDRHNRNREHRRRDARGSRRRASGRGGVRRVRVLYSREVNMADLCRGGAVGPPFDSAESLADMMFGGSASGTEVLSATAYCSVIAVGTFLVRDVGGRRSSETSRSGRRRTRRREGDERSDSRSPRPARRRREAESGASATRADASRGVAGDERTGRGDESDAESGLEVGRGESEASAEEAAGVGKLGDGENSVISSGSPGKESGDGRDPPFGDRGGDGDGITYRDSEENENDGTVGAAEDGGEERNENRADGERVEAELSPSVREAAEILSGRFAALKKEEDAGGGGRNEENISSKRKSIWSTGNANIEECCRLIVPIGESDAGRDVSTKGPRDRGRHLAGADHSGDENDSEDSDEEAEYIRTAR